MRRRRTFWLHSVAVFVLLLVSFFGGVAPKVAAADAHHGMGGHSETTSSSPDCQARCGSLTNTLPTQTKRDDEEQKEPQPELAYLNRSPFEFAQIQKITSTVDAVRQFRPPDIVVLNCIYRF